MNTAYVIEDQTVLRELVCRLIDEMPMIDLVGSSGDGREGLKECDSLKPTMVIVDIMVPSINGLEIIRQLKILHKDIKIIVFSAYSSRTRVQEAMQLGVNGIIHKNASITELEKGIEKVAAGESYMSGDVLETLRDIMLNPQNADSINQLTSREREVLQLVAEGNTTKEISAKLNISFKTADSHRTNIMNKLNIHDIAGLTRFAIQQGIIAV